MVNQTATWRAILMDWCVANNNLKRCREDSQETNQSRKPAGEQRRRLGKMLVVVVPEPDMDLI